MHRYYSINNNHCTIFFFYFIFVGKTTQKNTDWEMPDISYLQHQYILWPHSTASVLQSSLLRQLWCPDDCVFRLLNRPTIWILYIVVYRMVGLLYLPGNMSLLSPLPNRQAVSSHFQPRYYTWYVVCAGISLTRANILVETYCVTCILCILFQCDISSVYVSCSFTNRNNESFL